MLFAVIDELGQVLQINEVFGSAETLEEFNSRLSQGRQAIECSHEVTLSHIYDFDKQEFVLPPEPQ